MRHGKQLVQNLSGKLHECFRTQLTTVVHTTGTKKGGGRCAHASEIGREHFKIKILKS